ncbi:MAG: hypothetical protein K2Y37_07470 [Pirellulales bacterium]|nr:hypothetical protein [Pirellulales bacterium]
MSRNVQVVILCEDRQHEAFARRFLDRMGIGARLLRVSKSPQGRGSAEQFVGEQFAKELEYYRARSHRVEQALVVKVDADRFDVAERVSRVEGHSTRRDGERVAIFVPARNIETWLSYLDGQSVDETNSYPRLRRESDCRKHVDVLIGMCQRQQLRQPAPPSLEAACKEYLARLMP